MARHSAWRHLHICIFIDFRIFDEDEGVDVLLILSSSLLNMFFWRKKKHIRQNIIQCRVFFTCIKINLEGILTK